MMAWCIATGEYSNFYVLGVCASKEEAERLCERMNRLSGREGERYEVVGHPLLAPDVQPLVLLTLEANIAQDGTSGGNGERSHLYWPFEESYPPVMWWWRARYSQGEGNLLVQGPDHPLVRRTFAEQMARLLADPKAREESHGSDDAEEWPDSGLAPEDEFI
jgi:hypothetical protein